MTNTGRYTTLPALELKVGDYVKVYGEWFKIVELKIVSRRHNQWTLINQAGRRRSHPGRVGEIVTAYVWG